MANEIPIEKVLKDFDPYKIISFTNITDTTFVGTHNGIKYPISPGATIQLSEPRAELLAHQLANKIVFNNLEEDILKRMSDKELEKLDGVWQRYDKAVSLERFKAYRDAILAPPDKVETLKIVADGETYTCSECGKEFDKKQGLRLHIMKSHPTLYKELYPKK